MSSLQNSSPSSSKDVKLLETFTDQPMKIDLNKLLSNCKKVDLFKKEKRIGSGTYGL